MKLVLSVTLLFMSTILFSQKKTAFGFRGGVNESRISNSNFESKYGPYFGVFISKKVNDVYTIQPELGYSNQGGNSMGNILEDADIHYITISGTNKFFISGTGFHIMLAPAIELDVDDTLIGLFNRRDGNDVTFIDISLMGGIGFEFKNGLGVEVRYKQGIVDVFSGGFHDFSSDQLEEETQFNGVFQFGMTYKFNF